MFGVLTFMSRASRLLSEPGCLYQTLFPRHPVAAKVNSEMQKEGLASLAPGFLSRLLPAHTPLPCPRPRRHTLSSSRARLGICHLEAWS